MKTWFNAYCFLCQLNSSNFWHAQSVKSVQISNAFSFPKGECDLYVLQWLAEPGSGMGRGKIRIHLEHTALRWGFLSKSGAEGTWSCLVYEKILEPLGNDCEDYEVMCRISVMALQQCVLGSCTHKFLWLHFSTVLPTHLMWCTASRCWWHHVRSLCRNGFCTLQLNKMPQIYTIIVFL